MVLLIDNLSESIIWAKSEEPLNAWKNTVGQSVWLKGIEPEVYLKSLLLLDGFDQVAKTFQKVRNKLMSKWEILSLCSWNAPF